MAFSKFVRRYYEYATEANDIIFYKVKSLIENNENLLTYVYTEFNYYIDGLKYFGEQLSDGITISSINVITSFINKPGSIIRKCAYELYQSEGEISLEELLSVDYDHLTLTLFDEWCENNEINLNELLF